jgi:hypothetical protein
MTNIDSVNPPAVPAQQPPCSGPQVELEVEKAVLVLKHNRANRLKILITPSTCRGDKFRIEIQRTSGGGWLPLLDKRSMLWMGVVAGKFKLRGIATIEGSEVISPEKDVEVKFPTYAQITSDPHVNVLMNFEWRSTLKECRKKPNRRRERGFHFRLDTEANKYIATNRGTMVYVGPTQGAVLGLGGSRRHPDEPPSPAANARGAKYVVASFHTHTPTTFRPPTIPPRVVGPSGADDSNNTGRQVPGIVYDYVASPTSGNSIPMGHPKNSTAKLYCSLGINPRPTP